MKNFILLFLSVLTVGLYADSRTWTSSDGRTLEAELVSRTVDTVTLKRATDSKEFSLPIKTLSQEDQAFIGKSGLTITKPVDAAKLKELTENIPAIQPRAPLNPADTTLVQIFKRYQSSFSHIRPETIKRNAEMIRADMARDIKILTATGGATVKNPPILMPSGNWSKGGGAWAEVWAAQSSVTWLSGPLSQHLDKIEALAGK